jgi:D-glycero-D-manno-heptose 1,7-bisphosphate phosphatase
VTRKAVFLDLNGTVVLPVKPERLSDLVPIPGALQAAGRLTRAGFVCPVVTVQSRIANGVFSSAAFIEWFARFAEAALEHGAVLAGPYVCPHRYADPCRCKKPQRFLYDQAAADLGIVVPDSFVIGDSPEDIHAAEALGASGCLVRTGWAANPEVAASVADQAAFVGASIVDAVDWILSVPARRQAPSVRPPSNER